MPTNYCGDLIKGEYQFAFGGRKACKEAGFLIPHPGRIKKVKVRIVGDDRIITKEKLDLGPYFPSPDDYFTALVSLFTIILFPKKQREDPTPDPEGSMFEDGYDKQERVVGVYSCQFTYNVGELYDELATYREYYRR